MDYQDTELIKIATLQGRYGLESRQAVYDRINGLDIKPVARGKITPQQLELLDNLLEFRLKAQNDSEKLSVKKGK